MTFRKNFVWGAATSPIRSRAQQTSEERESISGTFTLHSLVMCLCNIPWWSDPVLLGHYPEEVKRYDGFPKTAIDWPVTPEVLYWGPKFLYERYQKPIYITENGMSCHDVVSLDGKVHDPNRIDFLARYLHALKRAAGEIDLRGYFQWSLMDNFEWDKGYSERFGLVYVDFQTQKRILKDSAYWYRDIIRNNGENL